MIERDCLDALRDCASAKRKEAAGWRSGERVAGYLLSQADAMEQAADTLERRLRELGKLHCYQF